MKGQISKISKCSKTSKIRTTGKKLLSFLLCAAMVLPLSQDMTLRAAAGVVYLDSGRISRDKLPEGDYLYFGTASATVEERGEYVLYIYREGDIDKEASVDIRAIDMTALYGKDYEIAMDDVNMVDGAGEETILQKLGSIGAGTSEGESGKSNGEDNGNKDTGEEEGTAFDSAVSASISIQDDEPVVHSEISFTKPKYKAKDGKAVLTVKRTGAEYSVCDMTVLTCEDTAKAGENYIEKNETLAFAPYETEKEIEIDVAGKGKFDVLLTGLTACTEGDCTKAEVSIVQGKKEAGVYYFSSDEEHGGIFTYDSKQKYGDKPTSGGNWKCEYIYDDDSNKTPKSYVEFYGLCAMYKKFNVSLLPMKELRYRTGTADSFQEVTPVQVSVKCGAQVLYQNYERDIYANLDENQSNLVFTIEDTQLAGHTGKFGHITGYNITVDAEEASNKKTVKYPEDFISYLKLKKGHGSADDSVNFSAEAVESEIKKVNANLDTIPYDGYFLYFLNSIQNVDYLQSDGYGYKGVLKFQPLIDYDDVTVEVLPADGIGIGHFTDSELQKTGKYTFHAGDSLDLGAVADDSDNYHASGYQYSVDGGISFNTISDGSDLFLKSSKKYQIRPVISENDNAIEVQFASDSAAFGLEILAPIPWRVYQAAAGKSSQCLCQMESPMGRW